MRCRFPILFAASAAWLCAAAPIDDAVGLYKTKHYPEARALFEKIASAEPDHAAAHYYLGLLAEKRGDTDEAIRQLERATTLAPANSDYFADLGEAYGTAAGKAGLFAQLSLAKKCQAALEKSVALNPDNLAARNGLVTYYRQAPTFVGGGMSKAYEEAAEIKKRDPLMGAAVYGQLYLAEKKYDEAFAVFEEVLKTAPDNYLALYSIGRTAAQTGTRLDRGELALRRCLELTPGKNEPGPAAVQWRLGNIAEKRGAKEAARLDYETALKVDPTFQQAIDSLAKLK
jgi:tetratricopeptide (TPR) repeat protein